MAPSADDPKPWPTVARGEEQDFTILRIREDTLQDPRDDSRHPRVIIEAADWVNVLPITREGQVVLVKQFRAGIRAVSLELPGGIVDRGEAPAHAAERELFEETGYAAGRLVPLGWVHPNVAIQTNRCFGFLALDCERKGEGRPDVGEDLALELRAQSELPTLVREGRITHALMVATLYLAGPALTAAGLPSR